MRRRHKGKIEIPKSIPKVQVLQRWQSGTLSVNLLSSQARDMFWYCIVVVSYSFRNSRSISLIIHLQGAM